MEMTTIIQVLENYVTPAFIVFVVCTLINVMLSTVKSIMTIKASRGVATIMNAVSYGFYTIVVKQLSGFDIMTTFTVTFVANLIGVYFSMWLLDKFKKDRLWKISVTAIREDALSIVKELEKHGIGRNYYKVNTHKMAIDIFSENQQESAIIKEILGRYKVKYHVEELSKSL